MEEFFGTKFRRELPEVKVLLPCSAKYDMKFSLSSHLNVEGLNKWAHLSRISKMDLNQINVEFLSKHFAHYFREVILQPIVVLYF